MVTKDPRPSPNYEQLDMLKPAGQIVANYKPEDPWAYKLKQSQGNKSRNNRSGGLYNKIASEGIQSPVHLFRTREGDEMGNGHHRVAVANDLDPATEVPVIHHDRWAGPGSTFHLHRSGG